MVEQPRRQSVGIAAVLSFLIPPIGWFMLWRGPYSPRTKRIVGIASGIWVLFAIVASPFLPERARETSNTQVAEPTEPEAPQLEVPAPHDPCVLVPPSLPGFRLATIDPPAVMARVAERCEWPEYVATDDSGIRVKAHLDHNDVDQVPTGRGASGTRYQAIQLGEHPASLSVDSETGQVAVIWRTEGWLLTLWLNASEQTAGREARRRAPDVAGAFAEWADPAIAGLDDAARIQRVNAVNEAVASPDAQAARRAERLRRIVDQLPDWTTSARISGPNEVEVTVRPAWIALPERLREQQAQALWQDWAIINTPENHDQSHLRLVDGGGRHVGGSGVMGSSISVE